MKKHFVLFIALLITMVSLAQQYIVRFDFNDFSKIPQFVSVDRVDGHTAVGYIWGKDNYQRFIKQFPHAGLVKNYLKSKAIIMAQTPEEMKNWDRYPTYDTYVKMMQDYAKNYPSLCRLDTIGTSQNGRLVLSLVISDNPGNTTEYEPRFFYTSTMHGDEVVGYVVLLRLIDYLLANYNRDSLITYLVNNYRIYINPLANPDGTYHGGNSTVLDAKRFYANGTDPNRDFYPIPGHSATTGSQETEAMKQYARRNHFVMAMNIHGGSEVFNYPWDVYKSSENSHADDAWFRSIGQRFVDTARTVDTNYMTDVTPSGVTEGGDWYTISGSRQDYMNYVQHCKEVTYEISSTKMPGSDQLPYFWNVSYRSLLYYILEAEKGLQGVILDTSNNPVYAKIFVNNYDHDSSSVYSLPGSGVYFRPLLAGKYDVMFKVNNSQLWHDSVTTGQGRTIVNYIPYPASHVVTFNIENNTGESLNNVRLIIQGAGDTIEVLVNGLYTDTMPTGVYVVNVVDTALRYNQIFYEAITRDDTLNYILPTSNIGTIAQSPQVSPVKVFPNPAHSRLWVTGSDMQRIKVFTLAGRLIMDRQVNRAQMQLDVSHLEPGLYLIYIQLDQHDRIVKKFIVQ